MATLERSSDGQEMNGNKRENQPEKIRSRARPKLGSFCANRDLAFIDKGAMTGLLVSLNATLCSRWE
jgi:hypothetical protein